MTSLRVGLIGYGIGGAVFHAPLVAATDGLELVAVSTSNEARSNQIRMKYLGTEVESSADALLARDDLDLIVVASPNTSHVPLALQAVERGRAVVIDKPVGTSVAEASQLLAAEQVGAKISVFQNRRWDGDLLTVKGLIESGRLGDVRRFESRFERWRPAPKGGWRETASVEEAGGTLFDLGAHLIDQALHLFGPVRSVYAEVERRRTAADDDAFVALRHSSGVLSHLWMSAVTPLLGPRFRVLGSTGGFEKYGLDPQEDALRDGAVPGGPTWGREDETSWGVFGTPDDLEAIATLHGNYPAFYAQVATAVRGESDVPVTVASAIEGLAVIEAAHRSASSGETVRLD